MQEIDPVDFDRTVNVEGVVVVDFWAPWCGPCRALSPIVEQVSKEVGTFASIVKVDVDKASELTDKFEIQTIPTMIYFKHGKEVKRTMGIASKADIIAAINSL
jgi:thioredoxin 1